MTEELEESLPDEKDDAPFLDPTASVVGEVEIGGNAFLFPGSIVEGDDSKVEVGEESIIMNKASVRSTEENPVSLGKGSFIAHGARLEGCSVGERTLVGMDAVVMEGAEVGEKAIVGTEAIVPEGMEVPDEKLVLGQPAEVVGDVSEEDLEEIEEIRAGLHEKRKEFQIIENRGERFDVFETPKRPKEILEENKVENREKKDIPDADKLDDKLKELEKDHHIF
ncbi:MAG: gamma carbonic anhydrase family protein [Candidatus Thermoplasmatota archaeon]